MIRSVVGESLAFWRTSCGVRGLKTAGPHLIRVVSAVAFAVVAILLSTVAAAFSAAAGFAATTYANGFAGATAPAGVAFIGGTLYAVDPTDDGLYVASAGAQPIAATRAATVSGGPTGITVLGGQLYVTRNTAGDVVRVNPSTYEITSVVTVACPNGIAADPVTGDLFVGTCDDLWRIQTPTTTPLASKYQKFLSGGKTAYGVAITGDDVIYVTLTAPAGQVWTVTGPSHGAPTALSYATIANVRGIAIAAPYLYLNGSDGTITKKPLQGQTGTQATVLTGGDPGDLAAIGGDGCYYASQGASIVRLANANGTCDLAGAGAPPAPVLTLVNTSTNPALIGGGDQTFVATLSNAATPGGVNVTFTVTGPNATSGTSVTGPSGSAPFAYTGHATGTDTVVATAVVNATTITSNSLTVDWPRAIDNVPPVITFTITPDLRATNFLGCPQPGVGDAANQYCGWYVSPTTTVTWTVVPGPGGSTAVTGCAPFTLVGDSPLSGTPASCIAHNADGASSSLRVILQAAPTPPIVVASASTADGHAYGSGTWTNQSVTVTYTCSSAIVGGVAGCDAPQTFSSTGIVASTSGAVVDVAGTRVTTTFGPIQIDKEAPTVTASAKTADNNPYTFGAWTKQDVTLHFTCADTGGSGLATCPPDRTLTSAGTATATATDVAGNVATFTSPQVNIDKTDPPIAASATSGGLPYAPGTPTNQDVVVSFTCPADGGAPIACPAPITVSASTPSVSATATDAAGNSATATFGPIVIDHTNPTIGGAATVGGAPYVSGTWTRGPVVVHFTCADDIALLSCPADVTVSADGAGQSVTGTARDVAGNSASFTVGGISIDTTPPVTTATLPAPTAPGGAYLRTVTVTLNAVDAGSGVASLTYSATGAGAFAPVTVAGSNVPVTITAEGLTTLHFAATDALGNAELEKTVAVHVVYTQPTSLHITSPAFLVAGGAVSARLTLTDGTTPVPAQTITFTAGAATATATTDAAGIARTTLPLAPGVYTLTAASTPTAAFFASSDTQTGLVVFEMTRFVVWGGNQPTLAAALPDGTRVQFWGSKWAKQVKAGDWKGDHDFKGWADTVNGLVWSSKGGDSKPPKTVARYIGVIVATHATRAGDRTTGNVAAIAVVRVDSASDDDDDAKTKPFDGKLGKAAFGSVLGLLSAP